MVLLSSISLQEISLSFPLHFCSMILSLISFHIGVCYPVDKKRKSEEKNCPKLFVKKRCCSNNALWILKMSESICQLNGLELIGLKLTCMFVCYNFDNVMSVKANSQNEQNTIVITVNVNVVTHCYSRQFVIAMFSLSP